MATRTTPALVRSRKSRALLIALASAVVVILATAGIWWGVTAASSASTSGPAASALPDSTRMGAVELLTDDLAPMRAFYVDAVGLDVLAETSDQLSLGSDGDEVLSITRTVDRAADSPTEAGLYHSAILYPDEQSLARALLSVATVAPTSFSGSADHAVSLAFYLTDPDGNGLEMYTDRPESEWVWKDGLVQVGFLPLLLARARSTKLTISLRKSFGLLIVRFGILPILLIGGAASAGTNLLFMLLADMGPNLQMLIVDRKSVV